MWCIEVYIGNDWYRGTLRFEHRSSAVGYAESWLQGQRCRVEPASAREGR